jgi:uncharacterized membrane protein
MIIAILALLGVLIAAYLTLYKLGYIGMLSCSVGSCERVNSSRWATFLGAPVAAWGLVTYIVLLALALSGLQGAALRATAWFTTLLSGWGVVFSAWLTWLESFVIRGYCIWCLTSATIMTLIFITSLVALRQERRPA